MTNKLQMHSQFNSNSHILLVTCQRSTQILFNKYVLILLYTIRETSYLVVVYCCLLLFPSFPLLSLFYFAKNAKCNFFSSKKCFAVSLVSFVFCSITSHTLHFTLHTFRFALVLFRVLPPFLLSCQYFK